MAESARETEVWPPLQFISNNDLDMEKENVFNRSGPRFSFPSEFPYEFDAFGPNSSLCSPVGSVAGSTETESSDEDDFFAGLTRRLTQSSLQETQKLTAPSLLPNKPERVLAGSPQSTLSGIGSWSGRSGGSSNGSPNCPSQGPSPPTTPFGNDNNTWDLIYAAAGQVARLKMSDESLKYNYQNRVLLPPLKSSTPSAAKGCNFGVYSNQSLSHTLPETTQFQHVRQDQMLKTQRAASIWLKQQQVKDGWSTQQNRHEHPIQARGRSDCFENGRCGRPLFVPQSAWPSIQAPQQSQQPRQNGLGRRPVLPGGSGARRECNGTGVFLPRRYSSAPDIRKKTSCPTVIVPAKVVQALNLNLDDMSGHAQVRLNACFASDQDAVMVRGNGLLTQQRGNLRPVGSLSHEIRLPQEWTY